MPVRFEVFGTVVWGAICHIPRSDSPCLCDEFYRPDVTRGGAARSVRRVRAGLACAASSACGGLGEGGRAVFRRWVRGLRGRCGRAVSDVGGRAVRGRPACRLVPCVRLRPRGACVVLGRRPAVVRSVAFAAGLPRVAAWTSGNSGGAVEGTAGGSRRAPRGCAVSGCGAPRRSAFVASAASRQRRLTAAVEPWRGQLVRRG